ncbi:unnamed protein product [Boreogadus saida]
MINEKTPQISPDVCRACCDSFNLDKKNKHNLLPCRTGRASSREKPDYTQALEAITGASRAMAFMCGVYKMPFNVEVTRDAACQTECSGALQTEENRNPSQRSKGVPSEARACDLFERSDTSQTALHLRRTARPGGEEVAQGYGEEEDVMFQWRSDFGGGGVFVPSPR